MCPLERANSHEGLSAQLTVQTPQRFTEKWMDEVWRQLAQGFHGEAAIVQLQVRDLEVRFGDDGAVPEEDVEVDGARAPTFLGATPTEVQLESLQDAEQLLRTKPAVQLDDGVQVVRLGRPERRGFIQGRAARHRDRVDATKRLHRLEDVALAIAGVRPQPDVDAVFHAPC